METKCITYKKSGFRFFAILFVFASKSRLLSQRELTCLWNGQESFAAVTFHYAAVTRVTFRSDFKNRVPVKFDLPLNLS